MIGIIDYNAGNITSVERALKKLGIEYIRSKKPADLANCQKLLFPGVGDAAYAMKQLKETGFDTFIKESAKKGIPLFGICLGSQIIFEKSEEGNVDCLGLIKGSIKHFYTINKDLKKEDLKVPHMGWNNLKRKNGSSPLLEGIPESSDFYFVHSYVICPSDEKVIKATADYGIEVPSLIQKDNIFASQFHPEKSGEVGLKMLENFCNL